jgi:hypothetical protein
MLLWVCQPLVTASYIPLSHSSDRMKLWEFMLNGGGVLRESALSRHA